MSEPPELLGDKVSLDIKEEVCCAPGYCVLSEASTNWNESSGVHQGAWEREDIM